MDEIPYYDRLRDFLVTDAVKKLYLIRHGETYFNLENRIGGDSPLTEKGRMQAFALAEYFRKKKRLCYLEDPWFTTWISQKNYHYTGITYLFHIKYCSVDCFLPSG